MPYAITKNRAGLYPFRQTCIPVKKMMDNGITSAFLQGKALGYKIKRNKKATDRSTIMINNHLSNKGAVAFVFKNFLVNNNANRINKNKNTPTAYVLN